MYAGSRSLDGQNPETVITALLTKIPFTHQVKIFELITLLNFFDSLLLLSCRR